MEEPKHLSASSSARSIPRIRSRRGDAKNPLRRTISANSLSGSGSLEGETTTSDSANQSMKERLRRDSQSLSDSCEKIILNPDKEKSVVDTGSTRNSVTTEEKVNVSPVAPPILADTPPVVVVASPEQSLVSRLHKPVHSSAPSPQGRNTSDDVVLGLRRSNRDVLRKSAHLEPAETAPLTRKSREEQTSPGRSALMSSGEDPLLLGRRGSLLGSGSGLLEFLGFRRKSSTSGIATDVGPRMAPPRMVVGNYLVARQRDALSQRSLRQEGKMLVVMRLNMNKVDFMVNLTAVTIVEQREEEFMGGRMMCVTLTAGRELVLISAGSDEETESLHELLTAWVRFYVGKVIDSPRGSPRRGQLKGYLIRNNGKTTERVWASQLLNDTLSLFQSRGRDCVATIDMSALTKCAFDRVKLEIVLFLDERRLTFQCENEESFVYWRAGILKYAPEQRSAPVTQTIDLSAKHL